MKNRLSSPTMLAASLVTLLVGTASAQAPITEVLVYPGGATVQRSAKLAAGARELTLACLPASFDADSLQVDADAGILIGHVSVQTRPRANAPECSSSPLDARIRELEDQRAALSSEAGAQDLLLGYLKNLASPEARGAVAAAGSPVAGTAEAIRKSGQEALLRQHQLQQRKVELERQLAPLLAERDRLLRANPQLRSIQIQLAAQKDGELRLSYRQNQAGWTPLYRAHLDTATAALRLERLAQVAQNTGEDWAGVRLRLSTVQPRQTVGLNPPWPWTLAMRPPERIQRERASLAYTQKAAPAPAQFTAARQAAADAAPASSFEPFDVSVFEGEFGAEFAVPGRVRIESSGQRSTLSLASEALTAQLHARIQPQQEAAAYLVTESPKPAGAWPSGSLQLFRDGSFIGQSQLQMAGEAAQLELFFGRDEALRVQIEPEQRNAGSSGLIGSRNERRIVRAYTLENRHKSAISVQLLESSPVAQHEDIRVQSQFTPKPAAEPWRKQPGIVVWQLPLAAGASQRFTADYLISAPKDAVVDGLP